MSFEERLELLSSIKETLNEEKKFYMKIKDWTAVSVRNRSLKALEDRLASVKFHARLAA